MSNPRAAQLVEAGMWLRLSGDHEGARRLFDQALKLEPDNARARQLLAAEEGNAAATAPTAPSLPAAVETSNPFAPVAVSTPMDLDWGSATGFAPTPIPFVPPVGSRAPTQSEVEPEADLPVELDIESSPTRVFGDPAAQGGLVFGGNALADLGPPPMMFQPRTSPARQEEVPWDAPAMVDGQVPGGSTMQFSRPADLGGTLEFARAADPSVQASPSGGTMEFARPSELSPRSSPPGGTMEFARLSELSPRPSPSGGTMEFARLSELSPRPSPSGGTMEFARPSELIGSVSTPSGETIEFAPPSEEPGFSPFDGMPDFAPPPGPTQPGGPPLDLSFPVERSPVPTGPAAEDNNWGEVMSLPASFAVAAAEVPAPRPTEPSFAPNATSAWDQRSNPGIKLSELIASAGSALDLVTADRPAASPPVHTSKLDEVHALVRGAKDLLGLDDHSGAMALILKAQELAPSDPEVQALRSRSESTLEAMFESKLGNLNSAPRVKLKDDEIIWLNLDHRAGFVLAQIDGQCTFEDLFSVSGMSRLDTARILAQLVEEGVIIS